MTKCALKVLVKLPQIPHNLAKKIRMCWKSPLSVCYFQLEFSVPDHCVVLQLRNSVRVSSRQLLYNYLSNEFFMFFAFPCFFAYKIFSYISTTYSGKNKNPTLKLFMREINLSQLIFDYRTSYKSNRTILKLFMRGRIQSKYLNFKNVIS
jgi:hypothetical protein